MSWAAIVSGKARQTSSSVNAPTTTTTTTTTTSTATTTSTTIASCPGAHRSLPQTASRAPSISQTLPTSVQANSQAMSPLPAAVTTLVPPASTIESSKSPSASTSHSSNATSPKPSSSPSVSSPASNSPPSLSLSSSGFRTPQSGPPTVPSRSRAHTNNNKNHKTQTTKHKNGKKYYHSHNNNYALSNKSGLLNGKHSESSNQSHHSEYERQSSSGAPPQTATNTSDMQSMWSDPRILSIYRLWTQHISFFMAQPSHFFGIFVTNPMFRQSVFEAGLTFHPDTDPAHPVLINLNSSRFGMAERISALSPPAGVDISGTNPPPMLSSSPLPVSTAQTAPPMPPADSPHTAVMSIQPIPAPVYLTPSTGSYYDAGSPMPNDDPTTVPIDGYAGRPILPEPDSFVTYENSPGRDDMLVSQLSDMKVDGSDTESERLSDGDYKSTNGFHANPIARQFLYNGLRNAHRTEPMRDGRRKVVSRVLDIRIPPSPICKRQSDKAKVELIEQIEEIFPTITPPSDYTTVRDDLLVRLRDNISQEWPGADIHVYGSAGNGLGLRSADVDMSLYIPRAVGAAHGREKGHVDAPKVILARLAAIMEQNDLTILGKFLDARVPVIKMLDPVSKLQVDVCVNNMLAVRNTELLKAYVDLDERFRYVCILVKLWAKRRDLNDAYHGTLSSYAYTLLVIHYLQTLDTCVLPCLQKMVNGDLVAENSNLPREMTDNGGTKLYNTYFDRTVNTETFKSANTDPVHELLLGFFHYYAYVFRYRTDLASIRLGVRTARSERGWDEQTVYEEWEEKNAHYRTAVEAARAAYDAKRKAGDEEQRLRAQATMNGSVAHSGSGMDSTTAVGIENGKTDIGTKRERIQFPRRPRLASKHLFCIEDPFDIDHDLSRGMEKAAVTVIRQEMMRAYEIIAETGDFESACEEYG